MSDTNITIESRESKSQGAYIATIPGTDAKGELTWTANNGVRSANHTFVPQQMRGKGIAAELVEALIADAKKEGFRIRPACSYVASQFDEHPEWSDLRA